jgi:lipopolysaccharide/colanic/teichoic acid biosynthesis glycosyltransferase
MFVGAHEAFEEYLQLHPAAAVEWGRDQRPGADPRITGIGKLLRRTSLDELPQLWNVVFGQISLAGPRPVTASELCRYGDAAQFYLATRPGLTGLWQVSGRNRLSYRQRIALDTEYVVHHLIWLDFLILLKTMRVVLSGDGK